ncbi:nitric oxide synthase oxygenase [Paenibacillus tarimensis]|uniref:nitric oxide synthase oxygenase n=1 Tax=Paenibacillus tarimensis TaxID=416012 RepID=UPI001F4522CF|nr:nitric oxide synthase oxygenase [Paenibacillus tarimensis]MCF2944783.1 nitric oxide synthase oxygenase [Paenibacillus tarimensis]
MNQGTVNCGEAESYIVSCLRELGKTKEEIDSRVKEVRRDIAATGTYMHTYEELVHGARMAWRNSGRCIGRLFWKTLEVFDCRHIFKEDDIFAALQRHIDYATNGGRVRPAISIFRQSSPDGEPEVRIWNHQLIRYAGYETEHGVTGDPASVPLTRICTKLGWRSDGTDFDILPVVLQTGTREPHIYNLPRQLVKEVPIRHPHMESFHSLGLRWYGVPFISDMALEIGGIRYTAAPFNGWYMGTEIGARNLADPFRYNKLPEVAKLMGLSMDSNINLWKDRALVELNTAVLYSFKLEGVSIVDHHTAADQFVRFEEQEAALGREVSGNWSWLIPPMSPAATPIFHRHYENKIVNPNYHYQRCPFHQAP